MRKVNSFKINIKQNEILIDFNRYDPSLVPVYGQSTLRSTLTLPMATVEALKLVLEVSGKVSAVFFLERMLRRKNGIDIIMSIIRTNKLKYKLSAHTHC